MTLKSVGQSLVLLVSLFACASAMADDLCVSPTAAVTSSVAIRKSATTSSAQLGKLVPGSSLPLVSDVPSWRQVQLSGQSKGYVSKRWTEESSCGSSSSSSSSTTPGATTPTLADEPAPLLSDHHPVTWWFVFKFNTASFPGCGGITTQTTCAFGGDVKPYKKSQQFVVASSEQPSLQKGGGCLGTSVDDPVGATFSQIYNGDYHYVVWNDQLYNAPYVNGCSKTTGACSAPWGHSKGILAWNDQGAGVVMQVSTPSWPGSGSSAAPRANDGNTLGCVDDNDVEVSQHFFAVKLNELDVRRVLLALQNASVVTDPNNPQLVNNGGPQDLSDLVKTLGTKSTNTKPTLEVLSSGVTLISKPSNLNVPPWQLVSAKLNSVPLRVATWWKAPPPLMPSTSATTMIGCWDQSLPKAGAVEIATSGQWDGTVFGLKGGSSSPYDFNHAKIGASTDGSELTIFGDMNQQGALSGPKCDSSQNGRGGNFFVVKNHDLFASVTALLQGSSAPVSP